MRVVRSRAGLGLVATKPLARGDFVIEYTGELIGPKEADRRANRYLFDVDDTHTIDGSPRSNTARYINHACRPNCEAEADVSEKRIRIYAKRSIAAGEEITIDYGRAHFDEYIKPKGCRCAHCTRA